MTAGLSGGAKASYSNATRPQYPAGTVRGFGHQVPQRRQGPTGPAARAVSCPSVFMALQGRMVLRR
ncbi:protein of unknown function [Cupriavidus taiwanensis]|uniref:Uncharacterized protein n=1 Tax=Cupriavidus taiwanensis TaxID=164546 RepID=A0A7Z7NLZ3_9BURK|nr:protein of unknown function [Cupriavidus taiwanensis]SOZ04970.1 hypothetical protein CBM2597_A50922 [Cupriavidus taiwanensis]SPC09452.1 hypothetical protein CBM2594_A40775 [Cupriavidus taiwanensis]